MSIEIDKNHDQRKIADLTGEKLNRAVDEGMEYLGDLSLKVTGIPTIDDSGMVLIAAKDRLDVIGFEISIYTSSSVAGHYIIDFLGCLTEFSRSEHWVDSEILGRILLHGPEAGIKFVTVHQAGTSEYNQFVEEGKRKTLKIIAWLKANIKNPALLPAA